MSAYQKLPNINDRKPSTDDIGRLQEEEADQIFAANVLKHDIDWSSYANSSLISHQDAGLLSDYDGNNVDEQTASLDERGPEHATVFIKALASIQKMETRQYLLTLIDELLTIDPSRSRLFHDIAATTNPYEPLMRILRHEEEDHYSMGKACQILSVLLSSEDAPAKEIGEFFTWLTRQLRTAQGRRLMHALTAVKDLLKDPRHAQAFCAGAGEGLDSLMALTGNMGNTQILYLAWFCVWLLTYNADLLEALHKHEVVQKLVNTVKQVTREKVVRVAFSTLRNLVDKDHFNEDMIGCGLVKTLQTLRSRKWKDDDLVADMKLIDDRLGACYAKLSSFEMYQAEINASRLAWSPVHSEQFWRENVKKFEADDFRIVRKLCELVGRSPDEMTLQVACYDLGEFARFYLGGKVIVEKLGGKAKIMTHLASKSPEVTKHALLAIQKLMVDNWEALNSGGMAALAAK